MATTTIANSSAATKAEIRALMGFGPSDTLQYIKPQVIDKPRIVADLTTEFTALTNGTKVVVSGAGWNGRDAIKVTPASATAQFYKAAWSAGEMQWADADSINFRFYIEDVSGNPYIIFTYDNDNSWTNAQSINALVHGVRKGWNYFRLRFDIANSRDKAGPNSSTYWNTGGTGASHLLNIRHVRFDLINCAGKDIWFDQYLTVGGYERPAIVLTFDNVTYQHARYLWPTFDKYGFKFGVCFQNANIGTIPGVEDRYNLLYANGHDIIPNDIMERSLAGETYTVQYEGIRDNIAEMVSRGWTRAIDYFALNNNAWDDNTLLALAANNVIAARAGPHEKLFTFAEEGIDNALCFGCESWDGKVASELIDIIDRTIEYGCTLTAYCHKVHSKRFAEFKTGVAPNTEETISDYITRADPTQALWANGVGADVYSLWAEDYIEALDYLATKEISVLSPSQWLDSIQIAPLKLELVEQQGVY